jgi:hypothetical protein
MKYYNFDTMFTSIKNALSVYLKENNITYELSGAAAGWHFEILTNEAGANNINEFLENHFISEYKKRYN